MRQTLIFAAIQMAFSIGIRQNAWKLSNKLDRTEIQIKDEFLQYVEPATEMFEVAEEMAMEKPPKAAIMFYEEIGNWWASFCRDNGHFPEREATLAGMAEIVQAVFNNTLSHTQRDALAKRLKDFK